jgi:hypothetical protein
MQCKSVTRPVLLLRQSALQPLWILACSTIVEYSQQEGFHRVPLPAARQTSNLEDQWLERPNSRHQVSPTSETTRANPSSGRWNYGRENFRELCRKWRLPRHFWGFLHAVNLRHGTDGFTSPPKEGVLRIFSPEKSDGFGRVWTRELGYQRPARLPLDHPSRFILVLILIICPCAKNKIIKTCGGRKANARVL